jgi:hypothetical protein
MKSKPDEHPDARPQLERMSEEMSFILDRLVDQTPEAGDARDWLLVEAAWWRSVDATLLEAVERSFRARQMLLRLAKSDGTWRNSVSYIGDPTPLDAEVCTYEYDRAEVRLTPDSPWMRPYAWLEGMNVAVDAWYTRNGMSAITAWLGMVSRMANEQRRRHVILTNHLYYETESLFELMKLERVETRRFDDLESLLLAASQASDPSIVFLDSSRPWGDAQALTKVLRSVRPEQVGLVLWDNTCAPAADHPFDATFPVESLRSALLLLRSHLKLDQLGLELTPLGSMALVTRPGASPGSDAWKDGFELFLADSIGVTGACASPSTLRLLTALALPNRALAELANRRLQRANVLGGELLAAALDPTGRYRVARAEHQCFIEIHLDELAAPQAIGGPPTWEVWDDLDAELDIIVDDAARCGIPIWKSASFGFHYTGLSWFAGVEPPEPHGNPHTVLRVCFGMHDPPVTTKVAEIIARQLIGKQAWRVPQ